MIFVFKADPDVKQAKMLLDLRDKVHNFAKDNEEGLLGFALHPKFKENGQLFVYYNAADEPRVAYLSRFRMSKTDPNRADPKSEERIMRIEQPFSNHNGGPMKFGKDGYLYIGFGDGGGRNDPVSRGQDLSTWMGKILRIDVDHKDEGKNYAVPKDNPFVDRKGAKPEIYAYGIRNPWRLTIDRKTGAIWIGDVGQDLWEEIHIIRRGGNYGWSIREGNNGFNNGLRTSNEAPQDPPIDPIWEYDHQVGKSITGGYVYRGTRLPELEGAYLYGDYVTGKIYALYYDQQRQKVIKNMAVPSTGIAVLSFGEDEQGEVYYMVESVRGRCFYRFDRVD
jgi:glucose/arabinose dehydrogenase